MKVLHLVLALLLLAGNAHTENLYKCVSGGGAESWQSAPCERGMHMTRTVAYTPETPVPVPPHEGVRRLAGNASRHHVPSGYRARVRTHRVKPDACVRVREYRETTLARVGLKRDFDLLSRLDSDVWRACG